MMNVNEPIQGCKIKYDHEQYQITDPLRMACESEQANLTRVRCVDATAEG